jgi:hypothetical protein
MSEQQDSQCAPVTKEREQEKDSAVSNSQAIFETVEGTTMTVLLRKKPKPSPSSAVVNGANCVNKARKKMFFDIWDEEEKNIEK